MQSRYQDLLLLSVSLPPHCPVAGLLVWREHGHNRLAPSLTLGGGLADLSDLVPLVLGQTEILHPMLVMVPLTCSGRLLGGVGVTGLSSNRRRECREAEYDQGEVTQKFQHVCIPPLDSG
jgi:hypothetical protein